MNSDVLVLVFLNPHIHFHTCIIDGVFIQRDGTLAFIQAKHVGIEDAEAVQQAIGKRTLALFKRRGILAPEDIDELAQWQHGGGFSLNADVLIESDEPKSLERLLRYCARPPFSADRLQWIKENELLAYQPKPNAVEVLKLTPYELLEKLAALIPPSKQHRHRYHGVLAPNSPYRQTVTSLASKEFISTDITTRSDDVSVNSTGEIKEKPTPKHRYSWAQLINRLFECLPLLCRLCQEPMRIISFITEANPIQNILDALNEPSTPPQLARSPGPIYDEVKMEIEELDQSVCW